MGIYDDLKQAIALIENMRGLKGDIERLELQVGNLREKVANLEGREQAIVLSAKEAVREALRTSGPSRTNLRGLHQQRTRAIQETGET